MQKNGVLRIIKNMKQIYQSFKKNSLDVYDVPIPKLRDGMALIKNVASVISVGTEGMVTSFGDKNLIQKARSRPDLVKQVLDKEGINFKMGCAPSRFSNSNTLVLRKWDREKKIEVGPEIKMPFDQVLIATGRRLNIEGLNLDRAGIQLEDKKIIVDKYLRTTNKNVYAIGDVAGDFMFTHWAEYQASIAITNMLSPFKKSPQREKVAWVTYTDPEIATFGKLLEDIKGKYEVVEMDLGDVDRAIAEGLSKGKLKLYLQKGKIVRGTMIAKNAGELSGELIQAMTQGTPLKDLFNRIYPYPTMSRINRKAIAKHLGKKLTTRASKILRFLYRIL